MEDAGVLQEMLRLDYEQQRQTLLEQRTAKENEKKSLMEQLEETREELETVRNQGELEPDRDEQTERSRTALAEKGIAAIPFYKTVEFSEELDKAACARMEAQLQKAGILDALVIAETNLEYLEKFFPEMQDTVLHLDKMGNSAFSRLKVNEELSLDLRGGSFPYPFEYL